MVNPQLGGLQDAFTAPALNPALWNASSGGGLVTLVAPGRVGVQATAAFPALGTAGPYEATGQSLYARVTPALAGTGGQTVQTVMKIQQDASNAAYFVCQPGTSWQAVVLNAGVSTTVNLPAFDPAAHAWWQLAESGGQWLFSASADGAAWTQVAAISYSWSPHAVAAYFSAGAPVVTGQSAYIEHVNTPLGASTLMPSWPSVRFQVAFNTGGTSSAQPAFVDLSSRLRGSWSAEPSGRQYELDQVQSGQLSCTLQNLDGALDPTNSGSPYYPNVLPLRQCRLQAVWPPTRNLLSRNASSGLDLSDNARASTGTPGNASALAPAPTGHTTAYFWTVPSATAAGAVFGIGSAAPDFTTPDPSAVPVTAGQQYSTSMWTALAAGGDTTLQLKPQIRWYSVTGTLISTSNGTAATSTVLGTWTQTSFTATAPAGAVCARPGLATATVPSANTSAYITAWQVEQAPVATPWTAGGVVYGLWAGYVERWPQTWTQQGTYGVANLTCVDVLAGLSQFTLQSSFTASLLALSPTMLYPLNEPSGSTQFNDITGQRSARFPWAAPNGGAGASITAGNSVTGSGSDGSAGPVVTVTNPSPGLVTASQAMYISAPWAGPFGPPSSGGWTRLLCFRTAVTPTGVSYLWLATGPGAFGAGAGSQAVATLYIDSSGHLNGYVTNAAASASALLTVPDVNASDGNWHVGVLQLSNDGLTLTLTCDQFTYVSSLAASDMHPTGCTSDIIGCQLSGGSAFYTYSGDLAYITEIPATLNSTSDLTNGFATAWAGETSDLRAQRIRDLAGLSFLPLSTPGTHTAMGGANLAGVDAMSALNLVGDTESGQVYVDGSGTLWLTGRQWRYLQPTPTVIFGELQASGEVPYLGDLQVDFDPTHVYNAVTVTNQSAPNSTAQPPAVVANAASQAGYLPRTLNRTINAQDESVAAAAATYLSQQYGQPLARISALTVDPAANPALWSTVLALGFGTRAQVNRRPPAGPGAAEVTAQVFLEHLTWDGDNQGKLRLALQLTSAAPYIGWGIAAAMHTTLAVAATAGTNTITVGALNGSANNPASAALPAGTLLTIGTGSGRELVSVLSVAATSPGYTSVVLTLAANLGLNHVLSSVVAQIVNTSNLPPAVAAGYPASLDAPATLTATGPRAAY